MSGYIKGKIDTKQYNLIPVCYDEMISEDNPVRVLDAFVDSLDMKKLDFKNSDRKNNIAGRPSYNPKDLLKLYLYGYFNGIRSSRKLAKECERNIEVFWLLTELKPDFRTIANFRKDNINNMKYVFKEFSLLCDSLNLIGKEIVAIDGSKFKANNGRRKNYTKGKLEKQIKYYEENIQKYIDILDKEDLEETDSKININKTELQKKIQEAKQRIEELEEIKKEVEKNGEISLTDPDAKHMKANNNGTDISHNVQIAVDSKEHLVVAIDVTSSPADQGQLANMALKSKDELKVDKLTVLADKGYWEGNNLRKCKENNITTIVSAPKESGKIGFRKSDFKYSKENDWYICPNGEKLVKSKGKKLVYKNPKGCKECPLKCKCTKNKKGRSISVTENEEILRENEQRQLDNMELYKKRQMIVEHVFGTVKRALGYTYLLLRGHEKVKGESFMHFLIYNIKRVCKIINIKDIIEAINAKKKEFTREVFQVNSFLASYIIFRNYFKSKMSIASSYLNC